MQVDAGSVCDIPVRAQRLCGLTWLNSALWFSDAGLEQIFAVNPESGAVVKAIDCPGVRTGLTRLGQNLLQVVGLERSLRVIDPETGQGLKEFPNPRPGLELCGIEMTSAGLWLGYQHPPQLDLRAAPDFKLKDHMRVDRPPAGVTATERFVAFADFAGSIQLLDLDRGKQALSVGVNGNPTGLTWDGRRFWYCDYTTLQLRAIEVPGIELMQLRAPGSAKAGTLLSGNGRWK